MMKEKLTIVKIGGNVIDDPRALDSFLADFTGLAGLKLLVHGGGALASAVLEDMGIKPRMVDGRRITDALTLKVVTMVYAGWINKDVVARLQSAGCNAAGFSGADGNAVMAVRRPVGAVDFGLVGDVGPDGINAGLIGGMIKGGIVPVFCAITHDGNGTLLNTNADTVASVLAAAMSAEYDVRLVYCFEKKGVLTAPDDDGSVVAELDREGYERLKTAGAVRAGMLAKLDNVFFALEHGVGEVTVKGAANLLTDDAGTKIKL